MNPLETYLRDVGEKHSLRGGDPETSHYGALERLLDEIGKSLKPKVRCLMSLTNRGAGKPDGGLYTVSQFQRGADAEQVKGQLPERGAIEAKPPSEPVEITADTQQVRRYFGKYGLVLVTNYREFLLLGRDRQGNALPPETYTLADSEKAFWQAAAHPQKTAKQHGKRFCEYIQRVMLSVAPLSTPQDAAWFLASYARDARERVENHKDLSALAAVRDALQEALGMKFTGEEGEHFFRSTLVQTIFYGVFSAWVLWHRERPDRTDAFDWHAAQWSLRVPFIRALYDEIATPSKLGSLGLVEVLDWTAATLNRVDRAAFFRRFQDDHAVQYFYEPFLQSFDPELRKKMGVWFTPTEIVQYQVARVDTVLREELGLPDGLADPNVVVLDPCCGTAAYLVEVLKRIAETLKTKGREALIASDVKKAAMTRVFGFEILPAPFVVSHLQLGLLLHNLGAPLSPKGNERVGVYLTNALTGWEPPTGPKQSVMEFMKELQEEKDAAEGVKRGRKILVILGNPPYNAFAGVSPQEELGLVEPYKKDLNKPVAQGGWGIKKFNLDDLYIRFFRLAERRICEMTGKGVVSFISNFSYLSDPSFVVMRQRFLTEFDKLWFDCMNGDSRETGKLTPEGKPDPSVFSTDYNREGIRVGTAVCMMVRKDNREKKPIVRFRHFWGVNKKRELLASLRERDFEAGYSRPKAVNQNRHSFRPGKVAAHYAAWAPANELCAVQPCNGLMEKRGGALVDTDRQALERRMKVYLDGNLDWDEYSSVQKHLTEPRGRFDPKSARQRSLVSETYDPTRIVRYGVRAFDVRWCYYTSVRPIWNEPRPALWAQFWGGNEFLMIRPAGVAAPEGTPFCYTRALGDNDALRGHAYYVPVRVKNGIRLRKKQQATLFAALGDNYEQDSPVANLSKAARAYLDTLKVRNPDAGAELAGLVWMHALAIGYSPAYLGENADGIRRDWPRVPLPDSRRALEASAALGRQLAALLDTETDVRAVTASPVETFLKTLGVLARVGGGAVDADAGDLAVTAGWGHAGKGGATMPGKGRIVRRPFDAGEQDAIGAAAQARGLSMKEARDLLGPDTRDVYLNERAYWRNVPAGVWEYFIGGYQVVKKWLSYREQPLLGRPLRTEEADEVTGMARRLAAIVLLQPALDGNYRACKAHAYAWPGAAEIRPPVSRPPRV